MNRKRITLFLLLFYSYANAVEINLINKEIDVFVKQAIGDDKDASEYKRDIHFKTVNNTPYIFVFTTIEGFGGSNTYLFYLGAIKITENKPKLVDAIRVGGKGSRSVDFNKINIKGNKIILNTTSYNNSDPQCCPSKQGKAMYIIKDNKLVEIEK